MYCLGIYEVTAALKSSSSRKRNCFPLITTRGNGYAAYMSTRVRRSRPNLAFRLSSVYPAYVDWGELYASSSRCNFRIQYLFLCMTLSFIGILGASMAALDSAAIERFMLEA